MLKESDLFTEISLEESAYIKGGETVVVSNQGVFVDGSEVEPTTNVNGVNVNFVLI